jgi:hypothetical protein
MSGFRPLKDVSPELVLPSEVPPLVEGLPVPSGVLGEELEPVVAGVDPVLGSVDGLVG